MYREDIRDESGFIKDTSMWSNNFAKEVADEYSLKLTDEHWKIIELIRKLYDETQRVPELRTVLKYFHVNKSPGKVDRKYIYKLFPFGYGQQACKIAGMREPKKLWLDL